MAWLLICGLLFDFARAADLDRSQERQLKAAFIYNFAKFVSWPASTFKDAQAPVSICLIGNDPMKSSFDDLSTKRIEGRPLNMRQIASLDQMQGCHILFISASVKDNLPKIMEAATKMSILTIGDTKGFADAGVMINFVFKDNKIAFEINPAAADKASLKISSKLLKLGMIISQ